VVTVERRWLATLASGDPAPWTALCPPDRN